MPTLRATTPSRPTGVMLISVAHWAVAAVYFFFLVRNTLVFFRIWDVNRQGAAAAGEGQLRWFLGGSPGPAYMELGSFILVWVFLAGFALVFLLLGIYLWKLAAWARTVDIVLLCVGASFGALRLPLALLRFHGGDLLTGLVGLAIQIWMLVYLFRPDVKRAFGAAA